MNNFLPGLTRILACPRLVTKEDAEAKTNPQGEFDLLQRDAGLAAMHGQLKQARDLFQRVEEKAPGIGPEGSSG
jgi:hypothetical protein